MRVHVKGEIKRDDLGGNFIFENKAKMSSSHLSMDLNIVFEIGEGNFNNV